MTLGILAHAARFFVFAIGDPLWLMVAINVVHGMCYAFFFAAVYIFVDERCPRDARASAQGLFNLVILGVGPFAGSLLWGWLGDVFRTPTAMVDFSRLFLAPAVLALAAALLLAVAFHPQASARDVHRVHRVFTDYTPDERKPQRRHLPSRYRRRVLSSHPTWQAPSRSTVLRESLCIGSRG